MTRPSLNGPKSERDPHGRFRPGNRGGTGNPLAGQVNRLRVKMLATVTPSDLAKVIRKLVKLAQNGDLGAIKLLFDRLFGEPVPLDLIERLDQVEKMLGRMEVST